MMAPLNRGEGKDRRYSMDQWPGYEISRRRLLQFFHERRVPNPVVLTGDIHVNWVNDLQLDFQNPKSPLVGTEFVGTSMNNGGNWNSLTILLMMMMMTMRTTAKIANLEALSCLCSGPGRRTSV